VSEVKHHYLFLLVVLVVFVAVFAGVVINQAPGFAMFNTQPTGTFVVGGCSELNQLFIHNNCYGPGDFDGYTCMKIMQAKHQRGC
jgi:hypothetical protein